MPRLRDTNAKLDNQLKAMNSKIKAAAKVSQKSSTYNNIRKAMQSIAKSTGQTLKTVNVNGVAVPQLSRANKYYDNTKGSVLANAEYGAKQSITAEMQKYATNAGQQFSQSKAFKQEFGQHVENRSFTNNLSDTSLYGKAMAYAKSKEWDVESMIQIAVYSDHYSEEWYITSVRELIRLAKDEVDKDKFALAKLEEEGRKNSPAYKQAEDKLAYDVEGLASLESYERTLQTRYSSI